MNSLTKTAQQLQRHYSTLITGDLHPVDHPVAKGDAREHGWRELLKRFLPDLYGVKSGFIIDSSGNLSKQIDCIVFRKDIGIELYAVGHHTVIPVEAVFAAFEVKPKLDADTLDYAQNRAVSVAKLEISNYRILNFNDEIEVCSTSADGAIIFGLLADRVDWKPKWNCQLFKTFLGNRDSKISLFMTVDDGCVDTFDTAFPASKYTLSEGQHAILNQLIRLAESVTELEKARYLSACCLTKYKDKLDKPKEMRI